MGRDSEQFCGARCRPVHQRVQGCLVSACAGSRPSPFQRGDPRAHRWVRNMPAGRLPLLDPSPCGNRLGKEGSGGSTGVNTLVSGGAKDAWRPFGGQSQPILPSSTSPTYPTRHSSLCAEKNLWPEACTFSLLFCQHRSGIQHNAKKNIRIQFSGMRGVNVIHLCVYVSGSAITSANLATAEDNLFNLERRGGHQRLLHRRCRTPTRGLLVSPIF